MFFKNFSFLSDLAKIWFGALVIMMIIHKKQLEYSPPHLYGLFFGYYKIRLSICRPHTKFYGPFELWGRNFGELAIMKGRGVPEGRTAYTLTVEQNGQAGDRQT
jgi:hypothetical protein